ncbi:MAG: VWA domain-containing protein [Gemmataceae bacterium]
MPYTAEISRANPTCFLFLIDQSRSMLELMPGGGQRTKAEVVADAVNHLLYTLVLRCVWGNSVLDRFHVGVVGYGVAVTTAYGGALAGRDLVPVGELARSQLRFEMKPPPGGTVPARFPVWFEPAGDGKTPMCEAMKQASRVVAGFVAAHPDCFPPIVINVTDGKPTDGNPLADAEAIKQLSSTDGEVLLFNLHVSSDAAVKIEFPDAENVLPDNYARLLFRMSSRLPPSMVQNAQQSGMRVGPNARGFVFNADLDAVVRSLDIGTRVDFGGK